MDIIELILKEKPSFQLESGSNKQIQSTEQLFHRSSNGVNTSNMHRDVHTIDKSLMRYIQHN